VGGDADRDDGGEKSHPGDSIAQLQPSAPREPAPEAASPQIKVLPPPPPPSQPPPQLDTPLSDVMTPDEVRHRRAISSAVPMPPSALEELRAIAAEADASAKRPQAAAGGPGAGGAALPPPPPPPQHHQQQQQQQHQQQQQSRHLDPHATPAAPAPATLSTPALKPPPSTQPPQNFRSRFSNASRTSSYVVPPLADPLNDPPGDPHSGGVSGSGGGSGGAAFPPPAPVTMNLPPPSAASSVSSAAVPPDALAAAAGLPTPEHGGDLEKARMFLRSGSASFKVLHHVSRGKTKELTMHFEPKQLKVFKRGLLRNTTVYKMDITSDLEASAGHGRVDTGTEFEIEAPHRLEPLQFSSPDRSLILATVKVFAENQGAIVIMSGASGRGSTMF
jgi:hypothetical protein